MYAGVWDSLGFIPRRDPWTVKVGSCSVGGRWGRSFLCLMLVIAIRHVPWIEPALSHQDGMKRRIGIMLARMRRAGLSLAHVPILLIFAAAPDAGSNYSVVLMSSMHSIDCNPRFRPRLGPQQPLEVTLLLGDVKAHVTRAQYAAILAIIMENFAETWSTCPSTVARTPPDVFVREDVCRHPLAGRYTAQVRLFTTQHTSPHGGYSAVRVFGGIGKTSTQSTPNFQSGRNNERH